MKGLHVVERLVAGARPTGDLHVGHLVGALQPFIQTQADVEEAFFVVADVHMFTTHATPESTSLIGPRIRALVVQCIAAGIDPDACTFYVQSSVVEMGQIYAIIGSLFSHSRLNDQASYVAMRDALGGVEPSLGLLGYPILEAADVIGLGATHVAVGEHNVAHVAACREIISDLNTRWGAALPLPVAVSGGANLIGLDGMAKMSKSLGNTIPLFATAEAVRASVARMATWSPDGVCVPAEYLQAFGERLDASRIEALVKSGDVSSDEITRLVVDAVESELAPIRDRRAQAESIVDDVLNQGAKRVREISHGQLGEIKRVLGMEGTLPAAAT